MKRILALILAFVMILAMGSLASAEEHKPVTINLYCDSATNGANEARKAAFEAQYPWITVELVEMPAGSSDRIRTLSTVLQAKDDSMDAFLIDCTWPEMFAGAGWLEPLEDVSQQPGRVYLQGHSAHKRAEGYDDRRTHYLRSD